MPDLDNALQLNQSAFNFATNVQAHRARRDCPKFVPDSTTSQVVSSSESMLANALIGEEGNVGGSPEVDTN